MPGGDCHRSLEILQNSAACFSDFAGIAIERQSLWPDFLLWDRPTYGAPVAPELPAGGAVPVQRFAEVHHPGCCSTGRTRAAMPIPGRWFFKFFLAACP